METIMETINKKKYKVMKTEFAKVENQFTALDMREHVGYYERIASLLIELGKSFNYNQLLFDSPTHGGFIPFECSSHFKHVYLIHTDSHAENIKYNIKEHKIKNLFSINTLSHINPSFVNKLVIFWHQSSDLTKEFIDKNLPIIVSNVYYSNLDNYISYKVKHCDLHVFIPNVYGDIFLKEFRYFMKFDEPNVLDYNNLINLCVMVKNGGEDFEQMLTQNLPFIDRWTILDTGSTDNTIEIIHRVLKDKKGQLFQEPFINFGASRNRCLELAGTVCKYNVMLDDTYILKGLFREFLDYTRGDQFTDSFSLYINQNDVEYASNRVFKTAANLKYMYKIHEVIQHYDNNNIIIPNTQAYIYDAPSKKMETRTYERKQSDLVLLFQEIEENPDDPRPFYYVAQTYNLLQNWDKAFEYYLKRTNHPVEGFIQEKVDACFEAARIANYYLKKPWAECEVLYKHANELDPERPEAVYFLGVHYFMEDKNIPLAYEYFLKAFQNGYPIHRQYCLKPTLSHQFVPKLLTYCCYDMKQFEIGEKAAKYFLDNNKPDIDQYTLVSNWHHIFSLLNKSIAFVTDKPIYPPQVPLFCFVAPGGFKPWTGSDILKDGFGGSETYIVEMSKYIQLSGRFQVIVFCNCLQEDTFGGVIYKPLDEYYSFVQRNIIHTCIVSRYSEYLPIALEGKTENVYLVAHDLTLTGRIVPRTNKLKKVFCLSDWHKQYFSEIYNELADITVAFNYGIDFTHFQNRNDIAKIPYKFIYSSLANRGLYELLCMWPKIIRLEPRASLHIYCDFTLEYLRNGFPDLIKRIQEMIAEYQRANANVFSYGWVNKKTLAESWLSADVWFYPCVFQETFCLTAFEAAASKTLMITTDYAGLKTSVGDRGVLIPMETPSAEWLDKMVDTVFTVLRDTNKKQELIDRAYQWVSNMSWENRANALLEAL